MRRQPNTEQGLGKQHLQRTVNMGKEQSALFPLGIYSRENEKKERERERDEESLRVKKKKSCERILNNGRGSEMNGGVSSEESHTGAVYTLILTPGGGDAPAARVDFKHPLG